MTERLFSEWQLPAMDESAPCIPLGYNDDIPVVLEPRSTFIHLYGEGDDNLCNQVVHFLPGIEFPLIMPLNSEAMMVHKERLLSEGFPVYRRDAPDEKTLDWLARVAAIERELDDEDA